MQREDLAEMYEAYCVFHPAHPELIFSCSYETWQNYIKNSRYKLLEIGDFDNNPKTVDPEDYMGDEYI
jgi:hypothetical protein